MAEDQGVNGDLWNDQAIKLLEEFKWETLGDSNVDLINDKGKKHGVDRLAIYSDSKKAGSNEIVIIEAKRYNTSSFKNETLDTWIKTLDNKITNLKNSVELHEKFPIIPKFPFRTGIIMAWFHNTDDYKGFREEFKNIATKIKLSRKYNGSQNKIYVFENDTILRLASLNDTIIRINTSQKNKLRFYYPSIESFPVSRSEVLNLNYMFSKFILAEYVDQNNIENKVVFYYGSLTLNGFTRLKYALGNYSYIDKDKPLHIYTYFRDDEFRKIKPEVLKLFDTTETQLLPMNLFRELPDFML